MLVHSTPLSQHLSACSPLNEKHERELSQTVLRLSRNLQLLQELLNASLIVCSALLGGTQLAPRFYAHIDNLDLALHGHTQSLLASH